jgi:serine/threonine-protein kinase
VVPVTDTGEHEGSPYLVQQLIEGGTLEDRLQIHGVLDLPTAVRVCSQVASGLDALYAAGLVHRDIKPANVLLDQRGDAYITDFGLAKDTRGTVLTRIGVIPGTCDYMAPEQIRADTLTAATDVYALGCVLFECLAGAPPFADRHGWQVILQAHLQDEPPDPCAGRPDLPREVGAVVRAALEKNPRKRPETASHFARMLRSAAGGGYAGVRQRPSFPT